MDQQKQHLVFMYGTLKTGEENHKQLLVKGPDGAALLGEAKTVRRFPLVVTTPFNIPLLLYREGVGYRIKGELYVVSDDMLKHLDWFEGHPQWYQRLKTEVELLTDSNRHKLEKPQVLDAWLYGLPRFKKSFLHLQFLENYSEKELDIKDRLQPYDPEKDGSLSQYLYDD